MGSGGGTRPLSLPSTISSRLGSRTPLVDTMVRRSPRLNPEAVNGMKMIKVREPAAKRRKKLSTVLGLEPPKNAEEAMGPIPIVALQDWALACGVPPSEVSEETLMEGHSEDQD